MRDGELAELERLIEVPDPDLYAALTGDAPLDPEYATALFDRIKAFRAVDHDACSERTRSAPRSRATSRSEPVVP